MALSIGKTPQGDRPAGSITWIKNQDMLSYEAILFAPFQYEPMKKNGDFDPSDAIMANMVCFTKDALDGSADPKIIHNAEIRGSALTGALKTIVGGACVSRVVKLARPYVLNDTTPEAFDKVVAWSNAHEGWEKTPEPSADGTAPWEQTPEDEPPF